MSIGALFSEADLEQVREAIARAESSNAGEIVPYLVGRVDEYREARWRGATLGAVTAVLLAAAILVYGRLWWSPGMLWVMLPAILGAGLGYTLARVPAIGRGLLTSGDIDRRVQMRAEAAFLEEECFRTRDRTGILIFVAIYERRALILGDAGINQAVPDKVWQELVDDLVRGIRDGRAMQALCDCIERCGQVLQQHEVSSGTQANDELNNGLRIRES